MSGGMLGGYGLAAGMNSMMMPVAVPMPSASYGSAMAAPMTPVAAAPMPAMAMGGGYGGMVPVMMQPAPMQPVQSMQMNGYMMAVG